MQGTRAERLFSRYSTTIPGSKPEGKPGKCHERYNKNLKIVVGVGAVGHVRRGTLARMNVTMIFVFGGQQWYRYHLSIITGRGGGGGVETVKERGSEAARQVHTMIKVLGQKPAASTHSCSSKSESEGCPKDGYLIDMYQLVVLRGTR